MAKIGQASIDERGKARGGSAGNQTGSELNIRPWADRAWHTVLRANDPATREGIAAACEAAVANPNIGYDQGERTTLFSEAQKCGWDLSKVSAPCETDCSALVAVCVNAAGISVSKDIYTGNMAKAIMATGKFQRLAAARYTRASDLLMRGDILIRNGHTAIVVEGGKPAERPLYVPGATYETQVVLNVRKGASTKHGVAATLAKGAKVKCLSLSVENGNTWMQIASGWVAAYYNGKAYVR